MKIFLTGHTGFIGKHLYPKLIQLKHDVQTDIRYLHSEHYDIIIHLAAVTHIRCEFDNKLIESNILLTNEIFKTPSRVVYASSCSAAFLTNPYAYTKQWAEYCGMRHGNALGLRFHNVYGSGNNKGIVNYLLQQPDGAELTIRGTGLIRDYIHVDDVVLEIIKQMKPIRLKDVTNTISHFDNFIKNIGVIDVGTGIGTTTLELVELFQKVSGKRFIIIPGEAWGYEPEKMVSNRVVRHCSIEEGLAKTIKNENTNSGS